MALPWCPGSLLANRKGMTLVEIIVGFGLLSILSFAIATMFIIQSKNIRLLEQRSEMLDIKNSISGLFKDASLCSCQLNPNLTLNDSNDVNLKFNSSITDGSQSIRVKKLSFGCATSAPVLLEEGRRTISGLEPRIIELANLVPTSVVNEWIGEWVVTWKDEDQRTPKQLVLPNQRFRIDPTSPESTRTVDVCLAYTSSLTSFFGTPVSRSDGARRTHTNLWTIVPTAYQAEADGVLQVTLGGNNVDPGTTACHIVESDSAACVTKGYSDPGPPTSAYYSGVGCNPSVTGRLVGYGSATVFIKRGKYYAIDRWWGSHPLATAASNVCNGTWTPFEVR